MKLRIAAGAIAATLAAPVSAQAATLTAKVTKPCYGTGDAVPLVGAGYTPGSAVRLVREGLPFPPFSSDATGGFSIRARLAQIPEGKTQTRFSATDRADPEITASSALVRVSATTIRVRPANASPTALRRIRANGFTRGGRTLYMHVARNGRSRNVRVGPLTGTCGAVTARRRFFRGSYRPGQYRLQFDTFRRYKRSRAQKVVFPLRVVR